MDVKPEVGEKLKELLAIGKVEDTGHLSVSITGEDPLLTPYRIGDAAATALAAHGVAVSKIWDKRQKKDCKNEIAVDVKKAALSTRRVQYLRQNGNKVALPDPDYPTVGIYPTRDNRFIMINGGYPLLRDGLLKVLQCPNDREAVAVAISKWDAEVLERTLQQNGLCGVVARSSDEWDESDQGRALNEKLYRDGFFHAIEIERICDAPRMDVKELGKPKGPLSNVRVLDLTHVLAGPTCAMVLAEQDATVLHISGPRQATIHPFVIDTGHGKLSAQLDLDTFEGRNKLWDLIDNRSDVFLESYRPGAIAGFGFSPVEIASRLKEQGRGIVYVSLNCYGHTGPWQYLRGWEQLAQVATGQAVGQGARDNPTLLPTYPNDYVTGYLAAYGAAAALLRRAENGGSYHVKVSLCQTAMWTSQFKMKADLPPKMVPESEVEEMLMKRITGFGRLKYFSPVTEFSAFDSAWRRPVVPLGKNRAVWPRMGRRAYLEDSLRQAGFKDAAGYFA